MILNNLCICEWNGFIVKAKIRQSSFLNEKKFVSLLWSGNHKIKEKKFILVEPPQIKQNSVDKLLDDKWFCVVDPFQAEMLKIGAPFFP